MPPPPARDRSPARPLSAAAARWVAAMLAWALVAATFPDLALAARLRGGIPASSSEPAPALRAQAAESKKKTQARLKKRRAPAPMKATQKASTNRISEKAPKVTAFPHDTAATTKAFAENRRDQLADAENAARAAKQDDRWRTVLFLIRDLDSGGDAEACFWRVLAYYRLGELSQARGMREGCDLPSRDANALSEEDATAVGLQPPTSLPELKLAGELDNDRDRKTARPIMNPAPYAGPPPTRFK